MAHHLRAALFVNMNATEMIGWTSSAILLATLIKQVYKQWAERTAAGISKWLFIGQLAASVGFTIYSWLTGNWVFLATNAALTVNNLVGISLWFVFHRSKSEARSKYSAVKPKGIP